MCRQLQIIHLHSSLVTVKKRVFAYGSTFIFAHLFLHVIESTATLWVCFNFTTQLKKKPKPLGFFSPWLELHLNICVYSIYCCKTNCWIKPRPSENFREHRQSFCGYQNGCETLGNICTFVMFSNTTMFEIEKGVLGSGWWSIKVNILFPKSRLLSPDLKLIIKIALVYIRFCNLS